MTAPDPRNVRDMLLEAGYSPVEVERMLVVAASPKLYIVTGTTGEYSDRQEWAVAIYADKAMAERHADLAMEEERRLLKVWTDSGREEYDFRSAWNSTEEEAAMRVNRFDPSVKRDYTGTDYHAAESGELRLELP